MYKKRRKSKATLIILLLLAVMIFVLAACSENANETISEQDGLSTSLDNSQGTTDSSETSGHDFDVSIPRIDLNDYGTSPIDLLSMTINGDMPLIALIEELGMADDDGIYSIVMVTNTDQYLLSILSISEDFDPEGVFDETTATIQITSLNQGWSVENPSAEFIEGNIRVPYLEQVEIDDEQTDNGMTKPIYAVYYNVLREKAYIKLDDSIINRIEALVSSDDHETLDYDDYENTDDYFFATDIYLYFEGEDTTKCEILMNEKGIKVLKFAGKSEAVVATELCDEIIDLVKASTDWNYIGLDTIKGIEKADIYLDDVPLASLTDSGKLTELENMLTQAKCIGYTPKTMMYQPILMLTLESGDTIEIQLDLENDLMQLGSSFHYDYGPGYVDGDAIKTCPS